jgi:hypothetical protein
MKLLIVNCICSVSYSYKVRLPTALRLLAMY